MALFMRQDDNRSELQQRLATELQDKARKKALEQDLPDGVDDSQYIKGTKNSSKLLGVWIVIGIIAVIVVIYLIIKTAV